MRFGSVFSGIGGMDLGLERAGIECRWQIEISEFCKKVLSRHWPKVKRYDDIRKVHGNQLESVDLVCGGFPCEDISLASGIGSGIVGERSGLWSELARILGETRPRFALIENVPALRSRGLALVLQDLWALGLMRSGTVFRLAPLVRLTRGTDSLSSLTRTERSSHRLSRAQLLPTLTANRWSGLQSHGKNAMLGPLNPEWCEWFMGFPTGWTELPASDEPSCLK
jgi:hypothetical protein